MNLESRKKPDRENALQLRLDAALAELEQTRARLAVHERVSALGQVAVGIGHELRQPLSVINSMAYCIRAALDENREDAASRSAALRYLDRLDEQVSVAGHIISSLSEYARTLKASRSAVDLNKLVAQELAHADIPIAVQVVQELCAAPVWVNADAAHLERVFHVLVTNSVEAMVAAGGEVRITTGRESDAGVFTVSDSGPGISDKIREDIFRPFFTTKNEGLGLGLALARALVEASDGRITFVSHSGRGATFRVALPLASKSG